MTHPQRSPRRIEEVLTACVRWFLGILILVSVLLNVVSVVARYVFMSPLFWVEPIITYMLLWCVFVGAALVTWNDRHLNVDILSTLMPPWFQKLAKVLGLLMLIATALLVVPQSWEATSMMVRLDQRTAVGDLPLSVPHSSLLVGFVLIVLAGVARLVVMLRHGVSLEPPPLDEDERGAEVTETQERP